MASRYELPPELDISNDEDFTKERLDRAWLYLLERLRILDSFKPSWEAQIDVIRQAGLERLNEAIEPVYDALIEIAHMGVIFSADAEATVEFGIGNKTFIVKDEHRARFAPTGYLAVTTADNPAHMMVGAFSSYNRGTGELVIAVDAVSDGAAGEFSTWRIGPSTSLDLHRGYVDGVAAGKENKLGFTPENVANRGQANGYASLGTDGKVPPAQLPNATIGALTYIGSWNAAANIPAMPTATPSNKGHYYVVNTAGTTNLNGSNDWEIGDWVVSNGSRWEKVDNSDKIVSVNGKTGAVVITGSDLGDGSVTNAKLAIMAPSTIKGRATGWAGSGPPADLTAAQVADILREYVVPPGAIAFFARNTPPPGWLAADGSTVARAAYPLLFAAIGTTWGTGFGTENFRLPDLRGEFIRGVDNGRGADPGRAFGSWQGGQNQWHTHGVGDPGHAHAVHDPGHAHGVYDPGHAHGVYDPGHSHTYSRFSGDGGPAFTINTPPTTTRTAVTTNTSHVGTGIGIYAAHTGVAVYASGTNIAIHGAGTGIWIGNEGGEARPRNIALLACIKY